MYSGNSIETQHTCKKRNIKHFFLLTAICLVISILSGCSSAPDDTSTVLKNTPAYSEIDAYIQKMMSNEEIPGLSIVIVQGDEIIYCKGFGAASLDTSIPVTGTTIFDLASLSKSFTALGTLLLEDRGLINIDDRFKNTCPISV
jgi:CubicO group peptidase (beta-lactamase class C family)